MPQRDVPGQTNRLLDGSELPLKTTNAKQLAICGISAPVEAVLFSMTHEDCGEEPEIRERGEVWAEL